MNSPLQQPSRVLSFAAGGLVLALAATGRAADPAAFDAAVFAQAGSNPVDVLVADFDGDGKPDVCTADSVAGQVHIRLGTGTGTTFRATTGFATGSGLTDIAWGHFNGDTLPDLVTVEDGGLVVALNGGVDPGNADALLFSRGTPITLNGTTFAYVRAADMDGDTKVDLVAVGNTDTDTGFAGVYQGDGQGAFPSSYGAFGTQHYDDFTLGDVTRDGFADVLICSEPINRLITLRSLGATVGFDQEALEIVAYKPTGVALADLSGDGVPEALVVGYGRFMGDSNEIGVSVLYNTAGPDSELVALNFLTGFQISSEIGGETELDPAIAVGDFDLDGDADVAVADPLTRSVSILRTTPQTNPGGAFVGLGREDLTSHEVAVAPWRMTAAFLESGNDTTPDLVTAHQIDNGISILKNTSIPGGTPQLGLASALKVDSEEVTVKVKKGQTITGYRQGNKITFFTTVPEDVPGLSVRPQSSVLPPRAEWINVPGAIMTFKQKGDANDTKDFGPGWYGTTTDAPDGELYFRVICKAPGYRDSAATTAGGPTGYVGPIRILPGPAKLKTELTFDPDTGPGTVVRQGQEIHGKLIVSNTGGTAKSGVYAAASIPVGCTLVSASNGGVVTQLPGIVPLISWSGATGAKKPKGMTILGHGAVELTFVLRVDADAAPGSELVCVAGAGDKKAGEAIAAALLGGAPSELIQRSQPLVVESQLKVLVSSDSAEVTAGQFIHFRLRLVNEAVFALNGVTLRATVPDGAAFFVAQYLDEFGDPIGGQEPLVDAERRHVTWNLPNLAANGGETTVVLGVRVKFDHGATPVVLDDFVLSGTPAAGGSALTSAPGLGAKSVDVRVLDDGIRPHLRAGQFVTTGRLAVGNYVACLPGDEITVVAFVKNDGVVPLARATASGAFPAGTEFDANSFELDDVPVAPQVEGGRWTLALGDLAPGQQRTLRYTATVLSAGEAGAAAPGQFISAPGAVVRSESLIEPTLANDVLVKVLKPVEFDISVTATDAGGGQVALVSGGETITHTWTVTNRGQVGAVAVQGQLSLPQGFTPGAIAVDGSVVPTPKPKKGKYPVLLPEMAPGATVTVALTSTYANVAPGNDAIVHVLDVTGGLAGSKSEKGVGASSGYAAMPLHDSVPRLFTVILTQSVSVRNGSLGYLLLVGNLSKTATANTVYLAAGIPAGATVTSKSDGGQEFDLKDGRSAIAWGFSSLGPEALHFVSFNVKVPSELSGCSIENVCIAGAANAAPKVSGLVSSNVRGDGTVDSFVFDEVACVVEGRGLPAVGDDPPNDFLARISEFLTKGDRFNASIGGADFLSFDNGTAVIPFSGKNVLVFGNPGSVGVADGVFKVTNPVFTMAVGSGDLIFHSNIPGFQDGISTTEALQRTGEALANARVSLVGNGGGNILNGPQKAIVPGSLVVVPDVAFRLNPDLAVVRGNSIVAAGGGNVLSHNGNAVVANGSGAKPGAGIVAAGGGNLIQKNALGIVAAGGGNIVAGGGGNIVAAGGGNIVAGGGGNIVAGGGGNIVAGGGGNAVPRKSE